MNISCCHRMLICHGCVTGAVLSGVCVFTWWLLVSVGRRMAGIRGDELFRNDSTLVHPTSATK